MNILSMLFKQFYKINPDIELYRIKESSTLDKKSQVKLQCIICSEFFDMHKEHICLFRNDNQEYINPVNGILIVVNPVLKIFNVKS